MSSPDVAQTGSEQLQDWAGSRRSIGVIENSTNHWLGTALAADPSFNERLSIVAFPTYAALSAAFQRGVVDGVLIDSVLSTDLKNIAPTTIVKIAGLDKTRAWSEYHRRIGSPDEYFAIAVATEIVPSAGGLLSEMRRRLMMWMDVPEMPENVGGLYDPLERALGFVDSKRFREALATRNHVKLPPNWENTHVKVGRNSFAALFDQRWQNPLR